MSASSEQGQSSVLIVSDDGMLGRAFAQRLTADGRAFEGVRFPAFDLTQPATLDAVDLSRFGAVINCAAYTSVDGAEDDEAAAVAVNGDGVRTLAQRCAEASATLVHFSTDYVFDGTATSPYATDEPHRPVNAYGRSKAAGEVAIAEVGGPHLLVRTSWLYAPWGGNFVRTMARLSAERDALRVVNDQRGRPSSAEGVATVVLQLLAANVRGTAHVTDGGACTWFDLAAAVAARVNPSCVVSPCTSEEFPRPAPRPAYSVLDITATEAVVGPLTPWQDAVADVVERLPAA